jgi:outer membrane usher protein FimD/PapC
MKGIVRHWIWISCAFFSLNSWTQESIFSLSDEAIQNLRAYTAIINGQHKKDIILIEGEGGRLYFPMSELAEYLNKEKALAMASSVYGCTPCIALDTVALSDFDEAANRVEIRVDAAYLPPQKFGRTTSSEKLPLQYGGGLASNLNILTRYDEKTDVEQYAADLDIGASLGRVGSIYSSHIFFDDGESIRGQSSYENTFEKSRVRLQLGDTFSHSETFGSSVQIAGIRISRAFEASPTYQYRPIFKYQTDARLPGTLELFIDGQKIKQEEYQQGQLQIENDAYGRGNELTLVLTDVMGNRRVVKRSLFDTSQNLAPGVVDFDISYGAIREDENRYQDEFGSGFISTGITNNWTQSFSYQGNTEFELASTAFIIGVGRHQINLEGAWTAQVGAENEGDALTARYSYGIEGAVHWAQISAEYFNANDFARFRSSTLSGSGGTLSFSTGTGRFYYGLSAFSIGDLEGGSSHIGYGIGGWRAEASVEYLETDDYLATVSLSYRPQERRAPRLRVGHSWERDKRSLGADISGNFTAGNKRIGYQLAASQDFDTGEGIDSRAGLSYQGDYLNIQTNYDQIDGYARSSSRLSTGFVVSKHNSFITPLPVAQSYVTALTEQRGVKIKSGGQSRETGRNGAASVAIPAYYPSAVKIDRASLKQSETLTYRLKEVRVAKGNYAAVEMPVLKAPLIIHILHNGVSDIFVNGKPFVHNNFGAYITSYIPDGKNVLEVDGRRYDIIIPLVTDELAIYEFDRASGELTKVSELFRSHH